MVSGKGAEDLTLINCECSHKSSSQERVANHMGLVRLRHTSEVTINCIYLVYGAQATTILTSIRRDNKDGRISPNLLAEKLVNLIVNLGHGP